jgi:hypothetical protein
MLLGMTILFGSSFTDMVCPLKRKDNTAEKKSEIRELAWESRKTGKEGAVC